MGGDYIFHRLPRDAQLRGFERAKDEEYWAHFWDPRVGKTGVVNNTFRYNYNIGRVTAMVVIAYPSDVHLVWRDETQLDFPPGFLARLKLLAWRPGKMNTKTAKGELAAMLGHPGPAIVTMNCEAILTPLAWGFLRKFCAKHHVLLAVDEDWATRWSARTQRLLAMARSPKVVMRRLLTGTPADEGPENLYFPTTFLKPGCLGFTSAGAFRARYCEYEEGFNRRTNVAYKTIARDADGRKVYRNLDELQANLAQFSDRERRVGSTKVYATRYFTMTDKQRREYDRLRERYTIELRTGEHTVANVLKRMTRLQAVARGYYPPEKVGAECPACLATGYVDDEECATCEGLGIAVAWTDLERIDTRNPAAEALTEEICAAHGKPGLVWCRFRQDVADAVEAVRAVNPRVARYDGTVPHDERERAYQAFRAGEIDWLVATIRSGLSRGHDCRRAKVMVYYSNEWGRRDRTQSEDRASSTDGDAWVDVIDLVAADTRDLDIIDALRTKRDVAALIMGDDRL